MTQPEWDAYVCLEISPTFNQPTSIHSLVNSIKSAISEGIHPKMITKGSSGSYFARAKVDGVIQTVGYVARVPVFVLTHYC
jgi:hypothetical protein